ncbi:type II secretion system protein [Sulfuriflexus mobilis]|uniref:type II secretion system protein n=1 Tax=Sulfuriflexus mobilis TaxID=1811807 RepID=UPI000F833FAC|nr:type II secretion system protein [Sulfuriflexus mobilis]
MMRLKQQGFTLVEMIIVIVISGILLSIVSVFIAQPIQGFIDLSRRATLVYSAESALRRMQRDVRRALPNSVRVRVDAGDTALELLHTLEGARYRAMPPPGNPLNRLQFNILDSDFDILGNFSNLPAPFPTMPFDSTTHRIAIYNIGQVDAMGVPVAGSNAYAGPDGLGRNVITPMGRKITYSDSGNEDHVNIDGGFQFRHDSSLNHRVYIVDTPVSYVCENGQLLRYTGYNFTNVTQPVQAADFVGPNTMRNLMADNVDSCTFTYAPGTSQRAGLATLDLTILDAATGEQIRLLHQVHVDNAP